VAPAGPVYQAGTLSGSPLARRRHRGRSTSCPRRVSLGACRTVGGRAAARSPGGLSRTGVAGAVQPTMVHPVLHDRRRLCRAEPPIARRSTAFFHAMPRRGACICRHPPSESAFNLGSPHGDAELEGAEGVGALGAGRWARLNGCQSRGHSCGARARPPRISGSKRLGSIHHHEAGLAGWRLGPNGDGSRASNSSESTSRAAPEPSGPWLEAGAPEPAEAISRRALTPPCVPKHATPIASLPASVEAPGSQTCESSR